MKQYLVGACAVLAISGSSVPDGAVAQTLVNDDSITVDGHVARDGKSVERATVLVSAWPNQAKINSMPVGSRIDMMELGQVLANSSGSYTFEIARSQIPAGFRDDRSGVNLRLLITDGDKLTIQEVTVGRTDDESGGMNKLVDPVDLSPSRLSSLNGVATRAPAGDAVVQQLVLPASSMLDKSQVAFALRGRLSSQMMAPTGLQSVAAPIPTFGGCHAFTGKRHGPYLETYGKVYAGPGVKGKVEHYSGASHTIGIAAKGPGAWGASGSQTLSSQAGYTTSFNVVDANIMNSVYQRYYTTECNTTGRWVTVATQSKPDVISSGPQFSRVAHVNYATCSPGHIGVTHFTSTTRQGTVSGGMDLPFVNVNAQSGWNSSVKFSFRFSRPGKICGNSTSGWVQSSLISTYAR